MMNPSDIELHDISGNGPNNGLAPWQIAAEPIAGETVVAEELDKVLPHDEMESHSASKPVLDANKAELERKMEAEAEEEGESYDEVEESFGQRLARNTKKRVKATWKTLRRTAYHKGVHGEKYYLNCTPYSWITNILFLAVFYVFVAGFFLGMLYIASLTQGYELFDKSK